MVDRISGHRLASRRQLVDDGHLQIAVEHQRQRSGDGSGAHDQRMNPLPFVGQRPPLGHAEPVLFVGDGQRRSSEGHVLLNQSVGADERVQLPGFQRLLEQGFLLFGRGAGEQPAADAALPEQRLQSLVMLSGQQLRGRH